MADEQGTLRGLLSRGGTSQSMAETVGESADAHLDPNESVEYQLPGKAAVTHEQDGEREDIGGGDGESLALVTDRQLLLVVDSPDDSTVFSFPYTEIREVELDSSLLKNVLVISVWDEGTYRFRPSSSDSLDAAVEYVRQASECWQFADALLDELAGQTSSISAHIEGGRLDEAETTLADARATAREIRERIEADGFASVLGPRVDEAERELHRARVQAHLARAKTLVTEAKYQTDATNYTDAYQRYDRAKERLETALALADEHGFEEPATARTELDKVENRMRNIEVRPMALAKQATERARGTDHTDDEVEAWQEAFEHYRDALTAGWGTDFEGSRGTEEVRFLAEGAVANLIDAKKRYADELEAKGDEDAERGSAESARKRYDRAIAHLEEARALAREFRSGDPDELATLREWVESKRESV